MADNTDTKNPTERICNCDAGGCYHPGGCKYDRYTLGAVVFDHKPEHLKYPDEAQKDDLIRALDKIGKRSKSVKSQIKRAKQDVEL